MSEPGFIEMRAGLVARGLLSPTTHQLTAAGHAYAESIMDELLEAPEPPPPAQPPVRWDCRRVWSSR